MTIILMGENVPGRSVSEDDILKMLQGQYIETWWLHFIATPDTMELMEKVKEKIQFMLERAHENNPEEYKKRFVTSQIIPWYNQFANGESIADIETSVRWKHVYYFSDPQWDAQHTDGDDVEYRSLNDKLMHDVLATWALKEHGASSVNLVMLCIPYARQDKTTPNKRQAASMDRVGWMLNNVTTENGYIITLDLHNPASKSSFQWRNFINLYTSWFVRRVIEHERDENPDNFRPILSPTDQWWYTKIMRIAEDLSLENTLTTKKRNYATKNQVSEITVIWDIEWKDLFIQDDILDTWGTLCKTLEEVLKKKPKSINLIITHGLFNKDAFSKLSNIIIDSQGVIKKVFITNSINKDIQNKNWIQVVDASDILANNILSIFRGLPVDRANDTDYTKTIEDNTKR